MPSAPCPIGGNARRSTSRAMTRSSTTRSAAAQVTRLADGEKPQRHIRVARLAHSPGDIPLSAAGLATIISAMQDGPIVSRERQLLLGSNTFWSALIGSQRVTVERKFPCWDRRAEWQRIGKGEEFLSQPTVGLMFTELL